MFLSTEQLRAWTGKFQNRHIRQQLIEWGYKEGKDLWTRKDGTLAVRDVITCGQPEPTSPQPDFSALGPKTKSKQTPPGKRVRPAWALSAKVY